MSMVKMEELSRGILDLKFKTVDRFLDVDAKIDELVNKLNKIESQLVCKSTKSTRPKINISKLFGKFVGVSNDSIQGAKYSYFNSYRYKIIDYNYDDNASHPIIFSNGDAWKYIYHPILQSHNLEFK